MILLCSFPHASGPCCLVSSTHGFHGGIYWLLFFLHKTVSFVILQKELNCTFQHLSNWPCWLELLGIEGLSGDPFLFPACRPIRIASTYELHRSTKVSFPLVICLFLLFQTMQVIPTATTSLHSLCHLLQIGWGKTQRLYGAPHPDCQCLSSRL